ncbi:MAG: IPT/TIG domain-containing protein [Solirubrobacteraceae bacterium]|nr:IPT/TIG domain-containing protein [Patulibacter sp.]
MPSPDLDVAVRLPLAAPARRWRRARLASVLAAVAALCGAVAPAALATPRAGVLSPNAGNTNEYVVVSGDDLGGVTQAAVTGPDGRTQTVPATGTSGDAYFRMPANGAGIASVQLLAGSTPVPPALSFTYYGGTAQPVLFDPDPPLYGLTTGGYPVHFRGEQLTGTTGVTFGGVASPHVQVLNDGEIVATAPPHAPGRVDVGVTTPDRALTLAGGFLYVTAQAPTITAVAPNRGLAYVGGIIQLKGTNLGSVTKLLLGSKAATILGKTATSITAWAPPQARQSVVVSVDGPNGPNLPSSVAYYAYLLY